MSNGMVICCNFPLFHAESEWLFTKLLHTLPRCDPRVITHANSNHQATFCYANCINNVRNRATPLFRTVVEGLDIFFRVTVYCVYSAQFNTSRLRKLFMDFLNMHNADVLTMQLKAFKDQSLLYKYIYRRCRQQTFFKSHFNICTFEIEIFLWLSALYLNRKDDHFQICPYYFPKLYFILLDWCC